MLLGTGSAAHLADVTGPRCLLLPGRGHQDDREGRGILWLHPDLKIQVVYVLGSSFGFSSDKKNEVSRVSVGACELGKALRSLT